MKNNNTIPIILFLLFSYQLFANSPDVQNVQLGITPSTSVMLRGGKEKTATGPLKALVIFVRYLDDVTNTETWPNYNVLPSWAQTFVNQTIPSNNIFTPNNLSDFFDRSSGGNGNGTLGVFHVIGDVKYVTTLHNQSYYSNDTQVFTEVFQTLDDPYGAYKVDFKQYDNWQFMSGGTYYNHVYKPGVGDGVVDHIWIINRGSSKDGFGAEKSLAAVNFTTNDGVVYL